MELLALSSHPESEVCNCWRQFRATDFRFRRSSSLSLPPTLAELYQGTEPACCYRINDTDRPGWQRKRGIIERVAQRICVFFACSSNWPSLAQTFASLCPGRTSFIGFSMGNVIIRSALAKAELKPLHRFLHTFLSLCGPHVGTVFNTSFVVNMGKPGSFQEHPAGWFSGRLHRPDPLGAHQVGQAHRQGHHSPRRCLQGNAAQHPQAAHRQAGPKPGSAGGARAVPKLAHLLQRAHRSAGQRDTGPEDRSRRVRQASPLSQLLSSDDDQSNDRSTLWHAGPQSHIHARHTFCVKSAVSCKKLTC
ncbi:hypothetical protein HPB51_027221 [Rhipicephalus microplus]|uniref:DUF676 domain-containing protein n=1 Tax=Rhipicephalus microplus TaxID=6941 RepID=A0A9J6D0T6_RHIMP|nr:hypothetical protein HPB51_027221 [Rhipicephalus microplus]